MRRLVSLFATGVLVAFFTVLTGAAPAQAHSLCLHHGNDFGCVYSNHDGISACDYERDGNYVYTEAQVYGVSYAIVLDRNGADAGCGTRSLPRGSFNVIRVCEDRPGYDSCTDWARV